jgi:membrane protein
MSLLLSFAVVSLLFAMMFKWLPDTDIAWGDQARRRVADRRSASGSAAIVTAVLFEAGKLLIGL